MTTKINELIRYVKKNRGRHGFDEVLHQNNVLNRVKRIKRELNERKA